VLRADTTRFWTAVWGDKLMPGMIINEILTLLEELVSNVEDILVDKVIVGLGYTAVHLTTGQTGVCFTFQTEIAPYCCQAHKKAGDLAGTGAITMAKMATSWDLSESVIGLATINALSSIVIERKQARYSLLKGNVLKHIKFDKSDVVVMIGNMLPLKEKIIQKVKRTYILERDPMRRQGGVLSDIASEELLPKADVAVVTGTSLANGTIDRLLQLAREAREIAVVGASASVLPEPLFNHGVTIVGGIRVLDAEKLLQIVAEGGGTRQLKKATEFVTLRAISQM
jgi:uncharacterized protein (DUF4213/DUF364 family)